MGDDDASTTSADGKPIRVSGSLKKSYFAETAENNNNDSGNESSSESDSESDSE